MLKDSKILEKKWRKEILKLFGGKKQEFTLLWRGSRDLHTAASFHEKCDAKGATFTICRGSLGHIFGGYNSESWSQTGAYSAGDCWLFNLCGANGDTSKPPIKLIPSTNGNNSYNAAGYGPTWGGGHDLHINNSMKSNSNYSNPNSFLTVAPGYTGTFTNTSLAGSYNFTLDDIEVWAVKPRKSA